MTLFMCTFSEYSQSNWKYRSKLFLLNRILISIVEYFEIAWLYFSTYMEKNFALIGVGNSSDGRNVLEWKKVNVGYIKGSNLKL